MIISILCGGSGTRLWPISRELMPKQFAKIFGGNSLFKLTLKRNQRVRKLLGEESNTLQVVANDKHYFLAIDEAREAGVSLHSFILETVPKNTAVALTFSALLVAKTTPDEVILALPSDHIISDFKAYKTCVKSAKDLAAQGYIITFGIKPHFAHTGYGYMQVSNQASFKNIESKAYNVIAFHEKPDSKSAKKYVESGDFYWNSGMFCYTARVLLEEMRKYEREIYDACVATFEKSYTQSDLESSSNNFLRLDRELSEKIAEKSIDCAVMERTKKLKMIAADFKWSDVGSFDSLSDELRKDCQNILDFKNPKTKNIESNIEESISKPTLISSNQEVNHCTQEAIDSKNIATCELEALDSKNNLIFSDKFVATIGLNDFVVVDTFDALLIVKKGQSQDVKKIVERLNAKNSELTKIHNQAFRPWGSYTVLQDGKGYKLKSIIVKPKQRLSLQKHFHRNEHWIVVSGSAIVQVGEREIFLKANESTYIPMGEVHRLTNPGIIDLVIIEVQVGEYLGEDDIVRVSDDYKRG